LYLFCFFSIFFYFFFFERNQPYGAGQNKDAKSLRHGHLGPPTAKFFLITHKPQPISGADKA